MSRLVYWFLEPQELEERVCSLVCLWSSVSGVGSLAHRRRSSRRAVEAAWVGGGSSYAVVETQSVLAWPSPV